MIKTLIEDIAFDKITLSQALTRSKIISFKINNETFQIWLKKELEGYSQNETLPHYRIIKCEVSVTVSNGYGQQTIPVDFNWDKMENILTTHKETGSIANLEENYSLLATETGYIPFNSGLVKLLEEMYSANQSGWSVVSAGQVINKLQLKRIIDLTKQKLIDTLLELDKEFPDLIDNMNMSKDKNDKIQNIVTNNIYGNSPVNVATGQNIEQKDFTFNTSINYSELEKLGVDKEQIEELKHIVETNKNDIPTLKTKTMKWLGSVAASVATKGLVEHIPAITEYVHHLLK